MIKFDVEELFGPGYGPGFAGTHPSAGGPLFFWLAVGRKKKRKKVKTKKQAFQRRLIIPTPTMLKLLDIMDAVGILDELSSLIPQEVH